MTSSEKVREEKTRLAFAILMAVPGLTNSGRRSHQRKPLRQRTRSAVSEKGLYSFVSNAVIGAAQKLPEESYSFKPAPEVRSFGDRRRWPRFATCSARKPSAKETQPRASKKQRPRRLILSGA